MDIMVMILAALVAAFLPLYFHKLHWLRGLNEKWNTFSKSKLKGEWQDVVETGTEFLLIAGGVGLITTISQTPLLFSEAGRASMDERGLLYFVIGFGAGFKGYMVPLSTYHFFKRVWWMITHRQALVRVYRDEFNRRMSEIRSSRP